MHAKNIHTEGKPINEARKALIMLHGRGSNAQDILSLAQYFPIKDFALLAPQATNNTWYPYSFMAPPAQNEPWLSSALSLLEGIVEDLKAGGLTEENMYFLGFSQGACLALEFVTRHATGYGGVAAFSGGLIGDRIYPQHYKGDFKGAPVFIGSSNPDAHIPVERVYATANILKEMNADTTEKIYDNMGHTINQDEIDQVNTFIFKQ
ncbi:MAG TPA: dienelactone hydrolase family protein [Flavitalea sp.]|nr:dienelactone hydrolase family protein [Flavitalea sp.]